MRNRLSIAYFGLIILQNKKIQLKLVITFAIFFGVKEVGIGQLNNKSIGLHAQYFYYNTSAFGFGLNCSLYSRNYEKIPHILTLITHYLLKIVK